MGFPTHVNSKQYLFAADLLHVYDAFDEGLAALLRIEIGLGGECLF